MHYPVTLQPSAEGGYTVSFPDIPEALTQGDTREVALGMALDALVTAFEFYFEDQRAIPAPSKITKDAVEVPASVMAKVLLLNAFIASRITQTELAEKTGVSKQAVTRLFNLHHATKIDTIQRALSALGKQLELSAA